MNCKNCGAPLKDGMTFCSQCGTNNAQPVNQTPAPEPVVSQPTPQPTSQPQPVPQPQAQNQGGYVSVQPQPVQQQYYYQQPQAPKKPFEEVVFGLNWAKISIIAAIIVGGLFFLSGFIGMFSSMSFSSYYSTSYSGVFTSLLDGLANAILWATVIVLLGKAVTAICDKKKDDKDE